jgi:hypothetical protein
VEGISTYLLTQGVLGLAVLVLGIVVVYQQRKIDKRDARIEELHGLRLDDSMRREGIVTDAMNKTSQSLLVVSEKIEIVKERH